VDRRPHLAGKAALLGEHGPDLLLGAQPGDPVLTRLDAQAGELISDEPVPDAACRGSQVAFEIDWADTAAYTGWSVLVRGEAIEVTGPAELARLRKLLLDPWAPDAKTYPRRGRRLRREALGVIRSGPAGARDAACGCR